MIDIVQYDYSSWYYDIEQVVILDVTQGNMLFVAALSGKDNTDVLLDPTLSDDKGNTYTFIGKQGYYNYYYASNIQGGVTTINTTFIRNVFASKLFVYEISGVNKLDQFKTTSVITAAGNTTVTMDAETLVDNELVIASVSSYGNATLTYDNTYTYYNDINTSTPFGKNHIAYKVITSKTTPSITTYFNPVHFADYYQVSMFTFYQEIVPQNCVKIRGKCKLRGNIKIR